MVKKITWAILTVFWFLFSVRPIFAITPPSFPSCSSPQGTLRVSYPDGTHGIVGSTATYTGNDREYVLSDSSLLQCFCSIDNQGIQTNWWKIPSLTDDDIRILKNQGWNYIANGALWGLDSDPYMALNVNYSCGGIGGPGEVLGEVTYGFGQILGLAGTGDSTKLFSVFALSFVFLTAGFILRFKHS